MGKTRQIQSGLKDVRIIDRIMILLFIIDRIKLDNLSEKSLKSNGD